MAPPPRLAIAPPDSWSRFIVTSGRPGLGKSPKSSTATRLISPEAASRRPGASPKYCVPISKMRLAKNRRLPSRALDLYSAIGGGDSNGRSSLAHIEGHVFGRTLLPRPGNIAADAAIHRGCLEMGGIV